MEERLSKFIASTGAASRREAERLISAGRISVNNKPIIEQGVKIDPTKDIVTLDGKQINKITEPKLYIYYKPISQICSRKDEEGRAVIYDSLPSDMHQLHYIGRLDINTEGLLLLTNDGELKRKFELPENNFKRIYIAKLFGDLPQELLADYTKTPLKSIDPKNSEIVNYNFIAEKAENIRSQNPKKHYVKFTLTEGKNREIRNICRHFNLHVTGLKRISYGEYNLGNLKPEEFMEVKYK